MAHIVLLRPVARLFQAREREDGEERHPVEAVVGVDLRRFVTPLVRTV